MAGTTIVINAPQLTCSNSCIPCVSIAHIKLNTHTLWWRMDQCQRRTVAKIQWNRNQKNKQASCVDKRTDHLLSINHVVYRFYVSFSRLNHLFAQFSFNQINFIKHKSIQKRRKEFFWINGKTNYILKQSATLFVLSKGFDISRILHLHWTFYMQLWANFIFLSFLSNRNLSHIKHKRTHTEIKWIN